MKEYRRTTPERATAFLLLRSSDRRLTVEFLVPSKNGFGFFSTSSQQEATLKEPVPTKVHNGNNTTITASFFYSNIIIFF